MKPVVRAWLALCLSWPASTVTAQDREFCRGFSEGRKALKGKLVLVPLCPLAPITPLGSTSYREGLKAGTAAAKKAGGGNTGGAASRERGDDFCDGFDEGWRAIKGDLALVPLCPLAPLTPLGSTPYREGLKVGMEKARSK
jgi:hypothetical protein